MGSLEKPQPFGQPAFGDRLSTELPSTMAQEPGWAAAPSDIVVN
jgi:hypothetical protein